MDISTQHNIKCPIFLETDAVIKKVIAKFWRANFKERQYYTQDIFLETKVLLSCSQYRTDNPDCLNCRLISNKYLQEFNSNLNPTYWRRKVQYISGRRQNYYEGNRGQLYIQEK